MQPPRKSQWRSAPARSGAGRALAALAAAASGAALLAFAGGSGAAAGGAGLRGARSGQATGHAGRAAPAADPREEFRAEQRVAFRTVDLLAIVTGWKSGQAPAWLASRQAPEESAAMGAGERGELHRVAGSDAGVLPAGNRISATHAAVPEAEDLVRFGDRLLRPSRTIMMTVTAYSPDARSCPGTDDGITASGYSVWTNGGFMVAADTSLFPFGTVMSVPGYDDGRPVPVLDRGGAIRGHRLDVLFPTHEVARRWGVQRLAVTVYEDAGKTDTTARVGR